MRKKNKLILFLFFVFINLEAFSQFVELEDYPFINYNDNNIEFFGSSQKRFTPLFEKIKNTIAFGTNQVRVLHIGEKQTTDDIFTTQIYYNFSLTLCGLEARRGMLWDEITILKSNKEIDYKVIDYDKKEYMLCKRFRLYHSPLNEDISIYIDDIGSAYKKVHYIDKGYTLFELTNPVYTVNLKIINKSDKDFTIYGHYLESDNAGFIYDIVSNKNINELSTNNLLDNQLKTMNFDMVVISLGKTAAYFSSYSSRKFKQDTKEILKKLRQINPDVPILLTTPYDYYINNKPNPRLEQVSKDLIEIAKTSNCAIWNFYKIMGSANNWSKTNLMDYKKSSLTNRGSVLQGELYYNSFWQSFEDYLNKAN